MEDKIYQIFVSSTFKDLEKERQEVLAAVVESGNMPIGMEYFPSTSATPFEYIKTMLQKSDYYILILAGKYGSIEPSSGLSYTELEYDYAQQLGIPTMVFLHYDINNLPMSLNEVDPNIISKLQKFREKASKSLAKMWSTAQELKSQVLHSIYTTIQTCPRTGWVRADSTEQNTDNFDYSQIAYHTATEDTDFWELSHEGKCFQERDVVWAELILCVFPSLQQMMSKYEIKGIIEDNCGDILDKDFERIFIQLQQQHLIRQEIVNHPEGGGGVYFCLTNKGVKALLRYSK